MPEEPIPWSNWLTIIGPKATFERLDETDAWEKALGARYVEWRLLSPRRHRCEFTSQGRILAPLQTLSRLWPRLIFLLDYESETDRVKGLVKAREGELESCEISY